MKDKKEEGRMWSDLKAQIFIGKNGLSKGAIQEIIRYAKDERIFKLKVLKNSPLKIIEVGDILQNLGIAKSISIRGSVAIFRSLVYSKRGKGEGNRA